VKYTQHLEAGQLYQRQAELSTTKDDGSAGAHAVPRRRFERTILFQGDQPNALGAGPRLKATEEGRGRIEVKKRVGVQEATTQESERKLKAEGDNNA
jgi:hypothetical protein